MALNIASQTILASPGENFLRGGAIARAENQQALQAQVMNEQLAGAQQQRKQSAIEFSQQQDIAKAKQNFLMANAVYNSDDPGGLLQQLVPDFKDGWDNHHGPGSYDSLKPEEFKPLAKKMMAQYAAQAGIQMPKQLIDIPLPNSGLAQRDPSDNSVKEVITPQKASESQHTADDLVFKGGNYFRPGETKPLTPQEVVAWRTSMAADKSAATTNARNNAQSSAIDTGDMSTAVAAFRQGIGNPPSMSRNPTGYHAFWNEYAAQAKAEGNTVQQQLASQRIAQSLKPAMEQTSKQISANEGFVGTLEKNIADADALQKRVAGDDPQYMNKVFNAWKRGGSTDKKLSADIAALDRWNNAIQGEAAKIASGGVGSVSASSDGQIKEQTKLMNSAQTYAAWRASADAALKEGKNRMDSLYASRDSLAHTSTITGGGSDKAGKTETSAIPPGAQTKVLNGKTYVNLTGKPDGWHESQ